MRLGVTGHQDLPPDATLSAHWCDRDLDVDHRSLSRQKRFDVRPHDAVLGHGSVPLPVLEQIVTGFITRERQSS